MSTENQEVGVGFRIFNGLVIHVEEPYDGLDRRELHLFYPGALGRHHEAVPGRVGRQTEREREMGSKRQREKRQIKISTAPPRTPRPTS